MHKNICKKIHKKIKKYLRSRLFSSNVKPSLRSNFLSRRYLTHILSELAKKKETNKPTTVCAHAHFLSSQLYTLSELQGKNKQKKDHVLDAVHGDMRCERNNL